MAALVRSRILAIVSVVHTRWTVDSRWLTVPARTWAVLAPLIPRHFTLIGAAYSEPAELFTLVLVFGSVRL